MKGSSAQGRTSSVTHVINGEFCQTRVVAASVTIQRASEHQKVALCKILQNIANMPRRMVPDFRKDVCF